jgi:tetratricopeptide (TPR) repeat protein
MTQAPAAGRSSWLVVAAGLVLVATMATTAARALTMEEVELSAANLAPRCTPITTEHAVSIQAATLYRMVDDKQNTARLFNAPQRKIFQSFDCGREKTTIYYYEYATKGDLGLAIGFVKGFIWGEDNRTSLHPEMIFPAENVLIIVSSREPEYFANAFLYGFPGEVGKQFHEAVLKYGTRDFGKAEKGFRSVTRSAPQSPLAQLYLGHSLFYQEKYAEAIAPYETARDLSAKGGLTQNHERMLSDQLGMAYALSGRLEDAKKHFETATRKDPDYPMTYYNLACVHAELGNLDEALANLKTGYAHRDHLLEGETYPDPRADDSFKKYVDDPKFQAAMKDLGH